jgi:glucoamylase
LNHEASIATYLREIADVWNDSIDRWMYVSGTDWCRKFKVEGYYVRIAPKTDRGAAGRVSRKCARKERDGRRGHPPASHLVSPDALALVRFGLRAADDPRIRDTAKVIDALLKVETPTGATWHRYNDDGYGEHEDGSPFDGTGIGRGWPLLTGERAHYELAAAGRNRQKTPGRHGIVRQRRRPDFRASLGFARHTGARTSFWPAFRFGHAAGLGARRVSQAAPLAARRAVFDQPPQTVQRYLKEKTVSPRLVWRFNHKLRSLPPGKILRIELMAPAVIHWTPMIGKRART